MKLKINKAISIIGSTGSIGRQTLEVADLLGLRVVALSTNTNIELFEQQVRKYKPDIAAVYDEDSARIFKLAVRDLPTRVFSGMDGLLEVATAEGADTTVTAVVGTVGLLPTLAAIDAAPGTGAGHTIALANKETLVCAGELVMKRAKESGVKIIPVDSEHSALYQCLNGEPVKSVKNLILTASGGPFRGKSRAQLTKITAEEALNHPVWNMGRKISIDSSTLMNKGLEVIEAIHLFSIPPDNIKVVIHPEGIVHSMVEFSDNSIIAALSTPDMRLPIQYALTQPCRVPSLTKALDITSIKTLTFDKPDYHAFPCLELAIKTASAFGTACTVLNAANEIAVELFLDGKLSFYGIYDKICKTLEHFDNIKDPSLDDIINADREARIYTSHNI